MEWRIPHLVGGKEHGCDYTGVACCGQAETFGRGTLAYQPFGLIPFRYWIIGMLHKAVVMTSFRGCFPADDGAARTARKLMG